MTINIPDIYGGASPSLENDYFRAATSYVYGLDVFGTPSVDTTKRANSLWSDFLVKIGKTNDTVRRGNELRIQLPEKTDLIHSIKTDDPSGIEAYWHKRFEEKRMQGEWFNLSSADVKAFKRWRRII